MPTIQRFAAMLLCLSSFHACSKSAPPPTKNIDIPAAPPGVQQAKVVADATGFQPSSVPIEKGKPASIVFVRTTDSTCARDVVFPDLKVDKPLPLDTPVTVDIPAGEARTLTFQCGMGMYKSAVLVQ